MRILVFVMVLVMCSTACLAADIDKEIYKKLENQRTVGVIVELKDVKPIDVLKKATVAEREKQLEQRKVRISHEREKTLRRLRLYPSEMTRQYVSINAFAGNITAESLKRLEQEPEVKAVYLSEALHIQLADSRLMVGADKAEQLSLDETGIDGRGETVCVLDTGVDYNHVNLGAGFGNVVLDGYDYVNNDNDPMDDHGHGTHVAGIISSSDSTYKGVAAGAKLVALKVCDSTGTCANENIVAGMDWCINNATKYNISVITISVGDGGSYNRTSCPRWLDSSINTAVRSGILVVASSGNDNKKNGIAYPSCSENVTSVGAVDKNGDITGYSDTSQLLDLVAPGGTPSQKIISTNLNNGFIGRFGTSMATPHVAASAALLQQFSRLQDNRILTPQELLTALKLTGKNVTDAANNLTFASINVYKAILRMDNRPPIIEVIDPPDGFATKNLSYTIILRSNERLSKALLEWNGTNLSMHGSNTLWNYTVAGASSMHYRIYGNDSANNWGVSALYSITLNDSAPIITGCYPSENLSIAEPQSQSFNISYIEPNGQNVTIHWYKNGMLVSDLNKFIFLGNYSTSGSYNISATVSDGSLSSLRRWILIVNNTNRMPEQIHSIESQTSYPNMNVSINMSNYIIDPDSDSMNYDCVGANNTTLLISGQIVKIIPAKDWIGQAEIYCNASDGSLSVTSNSFTVSFTNDKDQDGHLAVSFGGDDCNDNDAKVYPQAGCAKECYTGSVYDSNCVCSGGTYSCSTGGGGGSGGGGGAVLIRKENVNSHYFDYIAAKTKKEVDINDKELALTKTELTTKNSVSNVTIKIAKKDLNLVENAYQYFQIDHDNLQDDDIYMVEVEFKVDNSWLKDRDKNSVRLNWYKHNVWKELETTLTAETDNYTYYRALSPGLSLFAITAKAASQLSQEKPIQILNPETNTTLVTPNKCPELPQPEQVPVEQSKEKPASTAHSNIYLVLAAVMLVLAFYVIIELRSWSKHLARLEHYINKRMSMGHPEEDIATKLKEHGWPDHTIHYHIKRARKRISRIKV